MHSSRDDIAPWLRLSLVPGVSPAVQRRLLQAFGSPQAALSATAREICAAAEDESVAPLLEEGPKKDLLEATLAWHETDGCHLITLADDQYPKALHNIHDPPAVLYARGRIEILNVPAFAIVGSRNATAQGLRDAEAFAFALSEAVPAIMDRHTLGYDASAHRGGLAGGGSSIARMGTGADP